VHIRQQVAEYQPKGTEMNDVSIEQITDDALMRAYEWHTISSGCYDDHALMIFLKKSSQEKRPDHAMHIGIGTLLTQCFRKS